ncbi:MAG: hypothetical protein U0840_07355 [Gemmataceae bacterium]
MNRLTALVALLLAAWFATVQADSSPKSGASNMVTRTFQVADLVVPVDGLLEGPPKTQEDKLIGLIQETIKPASWTHAGGAGRVDYFPLTMSLVVHQTPAVQNEIEELLGALRKQQDLEVQVELRIISASETMMEQVRKNLEQAPASGVVVLDDQSVTALLESVQQDPRTNVLQAPKLTVFNGRRARIDTTDQQTYVAGVNWVENEGKKVPVPIARVVKSGIEIDVLPTVSADRRLVNLQLGIQSHVVSAPPGETQKKPSFHTLAMEKTLKLKDGETALLTAWSRQVEARHESQPPVLSRIPYLNRLFKNVGVTNGTEHTLVLVTSRIIVQPEEEEAEETEDMIEAPVTADAEVVPSVQPEMLYVNRRTFDLTYDVEPVGPARLRSIDVWVTRPGGSWQRYPYEVRPMGCVPITVQGEGKYGFTLVPTNTAGFKGSAPTEGDNPQVCVVVDLTGPKIDLAAPEMQGTYPSGEIHFAWRSSDDQKLAEGPVSLFWGETANGPWHTLVEKLADRGSYTAAQRDLPGMFYLRAEARDAAGNRTATQSTEPIRLDNRLPVIRAVRVRPRPSLH